MPTVEFSFEDLKKLIGKNIELKELKDKGILFVKGEIESEENGNLKVDMKDINRPDLWSVEGIARQLRGYYGVEGGIPKFKIKKSGLKVIVDKKVEKVRPKTVCAVVKNLKLNSEAIKQIIQLQEKVCQTFGRKRDLAAIGIYDYDKIKGPVRYTTFKPKALKFIPLGFSKEMTLDEILKRHPKGKEYGHLLDGYGEYPIFIDRGRNVLSMPPIINSNYTGRVDTNTKNVFVEVSGHNLEHISIALNVVVTAMRERGGEIYSVDVMYGNKKITTPDLSPRKAEMNIENCQRVLGINLSKNEIVKLLRKARFDTRIKDKVIEAKYIPYRNDIIDERDLIEEVAISYDYGSIKPEEIKIWTRGGEAPIEELSNKVRELCIGFGLQEIMTFILTSKESTVEKMRKEEKVVEIENPLSLNWSVFRNSLIPKGLEFLSRNKHVEYPQKIFEIGDVVEIDERQETKTKDLRNLSVLLTDNVVGYSDMASILDSFMSNLGIKYSLKACKSKSFIEGRCAEIVIGKTVGIIGEIHPQVLKNFELEKPVVALEINLNSLFNIYEK